MMYGSIGFAVTFTLLNCVKATGEYVLRGCQIQNKFFEKINTISSLLVLLSRSTGLRSVHRIDASLLGATTSIVTRKEADQHDPCTKHTADQKDKPSTTPPPPCCVN